MTDPEFRDAFHWHKDVLYRFDRMTGSSSAAEDVVQGCFLVLWRSPGAYDPNRGAVRAFLLGIVRNLILTRWRDERSYEALDDESFVCLPVDLVHNERVQAIGKAIQMLPPLQREALILADFEEMSLEEIARTPEAELAAVWWSRRNEWRFRLSRPSGDEVHS
jgi:RNA polymerase sigma-70 factor (ECF subfamily)